MSENYADAVAAVGWVVTRAAGRPVFGIGHSEGALHVARLAADEEVVGAVLIACAARRGEDILRDDPESKGPTAYRKALKRPVSPVVLETIANWLAKLSRPSRASSDVEGTQ